MYQGLCQLVIRTVQTEGWQGLHVTLCIQYSENMEITYSNRLKGLGLTLKNWETLWLLKTETAHVTTEKTKFHKNQNNEILWIKKKVEWPLTGSFTVNLYLDALSFD